MDESPVPSPPWAPSRPPRPQRAPITRGEIIDAALSLLDDEGASGLSMRSLAARLGTGPSTLYWHVDNKEQLFEMIFDRVIGQFPRPAADPERWHDQLREIARGIRIAFLRHRDLSVIAAGRFPVGPNALKFLDSLIAVSRAGGLDDEAAAHLTFVLPAYAQAAASEETAHGNTARPTPTDMRDYIQSLPAGSFPNLVAVARHFADGNLNDRFEYGLNLLVMGLQTQINEQGRSEPSALTDR